MNLNAADSGTKRIKNWTRRQKIPAALKKPDVAENPNQLGHDESGSTETGSYASPGLFYLFYRSGAASAPVSTRPPAAAAAARSPLRTRRWFSQRPRRFPPRRRRVCR